MIRSRAPTHSQLRHLPPGAAEHRHEGPDHFAGGKGRISSSPWAGDRLCKSQGWFPGWEGSPVPSRRPHRPAASNREETGNAVPNGGHECLRGRGARSRNTDPGIPDGRRHHRYVRSRRRSRPAPKPTGPTSPRWGIFAFRHGQEIDVAGNRLVRAAICKINQTQTKTRKRRSRGSKHHHQRR